jgi:ankyrin repeat protein
MYNIKRVLGYCVVVLLSVANLGWAAASEVADAAQKGNKEAVRSLLQRKADVNVAQVDGTTALHWAVRLDDIETADLLIAAGANVSAANREGVLPLQLAALNGNATMIDKLLKAGANAKPPDEIRDRLGDRRARERSTPSGRCWTMAPRSMRERPGAVRLR